MNYGGITFEHVWAYQIKCMMANQYKVLIEAIEAGDVDGIIAVCLRLGWNDAFKHISTNHTDIDIINNYKNANIGTVFDNANTINDDRRDKVIFDICKQLVPYYDAYLSCGDTQNRLKNMNGLMLNPRFCDLIGIYKDIKSAAHPLCIGHIQKMFNMATKLLLCLVISAEQASSNSIQVKLGKNEAGNNDVFLTHNNWWQGIFSEDNFDADCPLDSKILKKITPSNTTWSHYGSKDYKTAQDEIDTIIKQTYPCSNYCNLLFDFENWKD